MKYGSTPFHLINTLQGRIQDFKLGGGGGHLKKLRRAERGAKILGYFVCKITILRQKIIFFFILGGGEGRRVRLPWIRPCFIIPCKPLYRCIYYIFLDTSMSTTRRRNTMAKKKNDKGTNNDLHNTT